jgi:hypothetical protein
MNSEFYEKLGIVRTNAHKTQMDFTSFNTCPVCYNDQFIDTEHKTSCGHIFCNDCFTKVCLTSATLMGVPCPICRKLQPWSASACDKKAETSMIKLTCGRRYEKHQEVYEQTIIFGAMLEELEIAERERYRLERQERRGLKHRLKWLFCVKAQ